MHGKTLINAYISLKFQKLVEKLFTNLSLSGGYEKPKKPSKRSELTDPDRFDSLEHF